MNDKKNSKIQHSKKNPDKEYITKTIRRLIREDSNVTMESLKDSNSDQIKKSDIEKENTTVANGQTIQAQLCNRLTNTNSVHTKTSGSQRAFSEFRILGKKLGEGAHAVVRVARDLKYGKKIAVKTYNRLKLFDSEKRKNVTREIQLLKAANHINIAGFIAKFENTRNIHVMMEFGGNCSLKKLTKNKNLSEDEIKFIYLQILRAVNYLHTNGIVHRDLKCENVTLNEKMHVKLVDFGFARRDKMMSMICGTPNYMAPEICKKLVHDPKKVDVWALGIILYYLLTEKFPFEGKNIYELNQSIIKGDYDDSDLSEDQKSLLNSMLEVEPQKRKDCENILNSNWFN